MAKRENVKRVRDPDDEEAWRLVQAHNTVLRKENDELKTALKKCQTENRVLSEQIDGHRQTILNLVANGQAPDLGQDESWGDSK